MSSQVIEHSGVVKEIMGDTIKVEIINVSACATCHAKDACIVSDVSAKVIDVPQTEENFAVGDTVVVRLEKSLGYKALVWAYLLPFVLLMTTLFIVSELTRREDIAGLAAIGILVPYYAGLFLLRKRMKKKFPFKIKRQFPS